ncbi:MAG TPA: VC0807 family protein [Streptosporangiaceae bacterium]|nr:VC0807 family protein [Streptosporangiaceae bacterium]
MAATQTQNPETAPMPGHRGQPPAGRAPAGPAPAGPAPAGPAPAGRAPADGRPDIAAALRPLVIDIGIPVGTYYLLRDGFGVSLWLSLALSSIGPAVRAIAGLVAERRLNLLAALMLAVNLAGIGVSFLSGDPRAMIAKDSIVSSVIAFAILGSVALRRPLMSAGLRPIMTKGSSERMAAWDRLSMTSARFRRLELAFSAIWGLVLLAECAARLVGAYTLPVPTMVWLSTVMTLGAIAVAIVAGGVAAGPIQKMIDAETAAS